MGKIRYSLRYDSAVASQSRAEMQYQAATSEARASCDKLISIAMRMTIEIIWNGG
jgi:hypothetical protein